MLPDIHLKHKCNNSNMLIILDLVGAKLIVDNLYELMK